MQKVVLIALGENLCPYIMLTHGHQFSKLHWIRNHRELLHEHRENITRSGHMNDGTNQTMVVHAAIVDCPEYGSFMPTATRFDQSVINDHPELIPKKKALAMNIGNNNGGRKRHGHGDR